MVNRRADEAVGVAPAADVVTAQQSFDSSSSRALFLHHEPFPNRRIFSSTASLTSALSSSANRNSCPFPQSDGTCRQNVEVALAEFRVDVDLGYPGRYRPANVVVRDSGGAVECQRDGNSGAHSIEPRPIEGWRFAVSPMNVPDRDAPSGRANFAAVAPGVIRIGIVRPVPAVRIAVARTARTAAGGDHTGRQGVDAHPVAGRIPITGALACISEQSRRI
jgi:hypothetical protein